MISSIKEAIGFCCERLPTGDGFTWSLTTWFGHLLRTAETRYGPRDRSWTPLGIEFCGDIPQLWYPGNVRNISIMLTDTARQHPVIAMFQLAHETVHLLAPNGGGTANVFEEGVATMFAHDHSQLRSHEQSYLRAEEAVKKLLQIDSEAIRKLRQDRPAFYDFTPEFITERFPVPADVAAALCAPFERS